jgi:hypothetical protein
VLTHQVQQYELMMEIEEARQKVAEKAARDAEQAAREQLRSAQEQTELARQRVTGSGPGQFDRLRQIGLGASGVNYAAAPPSRELRELEIQTRKLEEIRAEVSRLEVGGLASFAGL